MSVVTSLLLNFSVGLEKIIPNHGSVQSKDLLEALVTLEPIPEPSVRSSGRF